MRDDIPFNNKELGEKALDPLYYVDDPEVGLNVVDLGLIYEISFDEDKKVLDLLMTLTTEFCPMGETIYNDVLNALTGAFPDWEIEIEFTFEPPWSQEMISFDGREFLGYY